MKKFLTIFITLILIFSLVGCKNIVNAPKGFTVVDSTGAKITFS